VAVLPPRLPDQVDERIITQVHSAGVLSGNGGQQVFAQWHGILRGRPPRGGWMGKCTTERTRRHLTLELELNRADRAGSSCAQAGKRASRTGAAQYGPGLVTAAGE